MLAADMGLTSFTSKAFCRASFLLAASSCSSSSFRQGEPRHKNGFNDKLLWVDPLSLRRAFPRLRFYMFCQEVEPRNKPSSFRTAVCFQHVFKHNTKTVKPNLPSSAPGHLRGYRQRWPRTHSVGCLYNNRAQEKIQTSSMHLRTNFYCLCFGSPN